MIRQIGHTQREPCEPLPASPYSYVHYIAHLHLHISPCTCSHPLARAYRPPGSRGSITPSTAAAAAAGAVPGLVPERRSSRKGAGERRTGHTAGDSSATQTDGDGEEEQQAPPPQLAQPAHQVLQAQQMQQTQQAALQWGALGEGQMQQPLLQPQQALDQQGLQPQLLQQQQQQPPRGREGGEQVLDWNWRRSGDQL